MSQSANTPPAKRKPPPFPWVKPSPETPPAPRILGGSQALKGSTPPLHTPLPLKPHHEPAKRQESPLTVDRPRDPLPNYPPLVGLPILPPEVTLMIAALREMAEVIPAGLKLSAAEVIVDPLGFVASSTAILEAVPHTSRLSQSVARRVVGCLRALRDMGFKGVTPTRDP